MREDVVNSVLVRVHTILEQNTNSMRKETKRKVHYDFLCTLEFQNIVFYQNDCNF